MHLHDLPPEVLGEILAALHDPNDLRSFIAASPDALQVFNLFRDRILLSVSLNAIEPEARPAALAIGHVPRLKDGMDGKPVYDFLDSYFKDGTTHAVQYSVPKGSKAIASFTGMVCRILYFVDKFSNDAWALLQSGGNYELSSGTESKQRLIPPLLLSRTERAAFQKAFFLLELNGTAFRSHRYRFTETKPDLGWRKQTDHFLKHLQPWELEALWCVFTFYAQLIDRKIRLVEDDFVAYVLATPTLHRLTIAERLQDWDLEGRLSSRTIKRENTPPPGETDAEMDQRRIRDFNWCFFYKLDYDLHSISFFSREWREEEDQYERALSLMVSLRSLFAYRLEHRTGEERAKVATAGAPFRIWGCYFDAPARILQGESLRAGDGRFKASAANTKHSAGYALYRQFEHSDDPDIEVASDKLLNSALRERAYVLRDAGRIQQPVVMDGLLKARNMPLKEADRLYNDEKRFGPSVQERLDDVGLYHCDMEDLKKRTQTFKAYDDL